jgi:Domain of unknown function (DU1801)
MAKWKKFENPQVAALFENYPGQIKAKLLALRQWIFDVAAETEGVGEIEETLKWGQPAYLTTESKSGSLIRIDQIKSQPGKYAMYFHCQTTLVDTFKEMFADSFRFEKNRAIVFDLADEIAEASLRRCIALALTYHQHKKRLKKY